MAEERAALLERAGDDRTTAAVPPGAPRPRLFDALVGDDVRVIAEVKRRSPSLGAINESLSAGGQARSYELGGAAAVSVLTEPSRFGGRVADLAEVVSSVQLPVLRKDFHVAPAQLHEARALGASGVLLIVRALPPARLRELFAVAESLVLDALVEVRDERELDLALEIGARIIGVNNRDLETLAIDPTTSTRLIPRIPAEVVVVAESGMRTRADVERVALAGADAVLVGSAVSAAQDPVAAVGALTRVARCGRGARGEAASIAGGAG